MTRERIFLNGLWDWYIPGGSKRKIEVPSSYLCVGEAIFERTFQINLPKDKRAILRFEGIAYEGEVTVNKKHIGTMLPYSRYDFDITDCLVQEENHIRVILKDINASYGPTEGWENYGGIIWDVYIEVVDDIYISDYQFITSFSDNYKKAHCTLNVWLNNPLGKIYRGEIEASLSYNDVEYTRVSKDIEITSREGIFKLEFDVFNPLLWSPEFPHLYDLKIELKSNRETIDVTGQKVGFKEFIKRGTRFYLNGQKIILNGVCRHHMWGEQGHTLTLEQMEKDMKMIKDMGANYVRLVHYPHPKEIIEIADRLGLMVSEEPGLWWSDLNNPVIADSALEVLRRTILRDRNNPSLIFWLIFNECIFAGDYISRAKKLCKELDPTRMVSAANVMNPEWTKNVFTKEDLDFYTFHPYGYSPGDPYGYDRMAIIQKGYGSNEPFTSLEEILSILNDKPVVFTEWGGGRTFENHTIVRNFWRVISSFLSNEDSNLMGTSYWCWNDYFEFSRWLPGDIKGISASGLVDIWRNKRSNYYLLSELFSQLKYRTIEKPKLDFISNLYPQLDNYKFEPLDFTSLFGSKEQEKAWKSALERTALENKRRRKKINLIGPIIPEKLEDIGGIPVGINRGRPVVLSEEVNRIVIKINKICSKLFIFGHTTLPSGYPVKGKLGEEIAKYVLVYTDGTKREIVLRNGIEITTSNIIWGPSRLNPVTSSVYQTLKITVDPIYEIYIVNCFILDVDSSKTLDSITFELLNPDYIPLLYGITLGIK